MIAATAVGAVALSPTGGAATALVVACAALDVVLGAPFARSLEHVAPLLLFLAAGLTLAGIAQRSGLAERVADRLAELARGHGGLLFALVCGTCAVATAIVSLDGAVVLMLPVLLALRARHGAPLAPLLLGTVAVANAASLAVPQGNPTNLVVIEQLGLSPAGFLERMLLPGLAATAVCAAGAALAERHALRGGYRLPAGTQRTSLDTAERHAAAALATAGVAAFASPLLGVAACWPFAIVAAAAIALHPRPRPRPALPLRLGAQVTGLLVVVGALGLSPPAIAADPAGLLATAALVGVAAALANNLPVSVSAAGLLAAGPSAYAASIGLAVGSLATPQGSVATMIATDMAAVALPVRRLLPLAAAGLGAATLVLALQS